MSASLLVLHLDTDTESLLRAKMYDKRLFITPNVSFSFIFAYEVYIYQLIRIPDLVVFFNGGLILKKKLRTQCFLVDKSSLVVMTIWSFSHS